MSKSSDTRGQTIARRHSTSAGQPHARDTRPLLFITGDRAHSKEFSEQAYRLAAEPKELYLVPGAGHVDLYDRVKLIPWDKLTAFFRQSLN